MALGASQALEENNYQEITITGFDALEDGLKGIKSN